MHRPDDLQKVTPIIFQGLVKALPLRFTLGEFLEKAEQRGLPAQQSYAYLQTLKRAGAVVDDGFWFTKRER